AFELAERYDRAAPKWQRTTSRLGAPRGYDFLFERFLTQSQLARTRTLRALDCGIGGGQFSLALARTWAGPLLIDGVDISPAMVAETRRNLRASNIEARVIQANVRTLPYPANRFDLIIAAHILEHLPDPIVALKEMRRVLKPGGWLVACFTRTSLLGRYVQLKWRTHRLSDQLAQSWLQEAGLQPQRSPSKLPGLTGLISLPALARAATGE
ncbi:MAG: class I SAM-dependent methyltransferase, partial [Pseudomonadota bacterium]